MNAITLIRNWKLSSWDDGISYSWTCRPTYYRVPHTIFPIIEMMIGQLVSLQSSFNSIGKLLSLQCYIAVYCLSNSAFRRYLRSIALIKKSNYGAAFHYRLCNRSYQFG